MAVRATSSLLSLIFVPAMAGATTLPVNVNEADREALQALEGVGPATAEAIIEDRQANGAYQRKVELTRVKGIGDATLEAIRDDVTLE
ncbi:ComEA family DNA-binding protein [Spiribacter pallidus]|jgi:competence protein ComEA|uniref:Helix-hairpin-helix domain-containing protein n=1 Tax=Spiribacter pallidus TaxID=1987936 RepID=A0ABV3TBT7_9GAMM